MNAAPVAASAAAPGVVSPAVPATAEDWPVALAALREFASDPMGAFDPPGVLDEASARAWTSGLAAKGLLFLAVEPGNPAPAGYVCFHETPDGALDLGFLLFRARRGRGLARTACAEALRRVAAARPGALFVATTAAANVRAVRLLEALGFVRVSSRRVPFASPPAPGSAPDFEELHFRLPVDNGEQCRCDEQG